MRTPLQSSGSQPTKMVRYNAIGMVPEFQLDPRSDVPLYRQLYQQLRKHISSGSFRRGERLPATRELAGSLGVNRATVSAAYALLESDGLIDGHVGRGSFVRGDAPAAPLNWEQMLPPPAPEPAPPAPPGAISFTNSRPAEDLFPISAFRESCLEVLAEPRLASILQLGSPHGYPPLRHALLDLARESGVAREGDDLLVTSGCQQALDLLARVLIRPGDTALIEDPVYPGLRNLLAAAGARLAGVPVGPAGIDMEALEREARAVRPKLVVVTSNFQNPTGATVPAAHRAAILRLARELRFAVIENDIYGELRYRGEAVPSLKKLDEGGETVLVRSFSKITFPGLRVGWLIGPKSLVARLAEAKKLADLHTDQLAQAVLLKFLATGRLAEHKARVLSAGAERLRAVIAACERSLPAGTEFTRPEGGMNLWVRLPAPLDAGALLDRAHREGAAYLPGSYFEVSRRAPEALRLSFAGLAPEAIRAGVAILGRIFSGELARARLEQSEPAPAIV
jgi:2-aminoadipate transaminase